MSNYAVVQCKPNELQRIDPHVMVSYRNKDGMLKVLVSEKDRIPATFHISFMLQIFMGDVENFDEKFSTVFFIMSIIFLITSYLVSVHIYKNKEF